MAWVEVVSKRERKAKHFFDISTGKWMAEFTIHDRHYKDAAEAWQDVDETLVDDASIPGLSKKCDKTQHAIYLGAGGERRWYPRRNVTTEYVAITGIEYYTNRWRSLNLPTPVWSGNGADWDMANLSASLVNTWRQIKTSFILKDATAPTRLRFALTLVGLTLDSTTWEVKSGSTVVGSIPPPRFTDANDNPVPVTTTYAGGYIEWVVNPAGAVYPLISHSVTFTDGYGEATNTACDVFFRKDIATLNLGTHNGLWANTGTYQATSLLLFTLSSIPAGVTYDSITLTLYCNYTGDTKTNNFARILDANSGWVEGTKNEALAGSGEPCWNAKAADGSGGITTKWAGDAAGDGGADGGCTVSGTDFSSTNLASLSVSTTGSKDIALGATEFDLMRASNNGLIIYVTGTDNLDATKYSSSDHATTGERPKLVVVYTSGTVYELTVQGTTHAQSADNVTLTYNTPSYNRIIPIADIANTGWNPSVSTDAFAMLDDAATDATADGDYVRTNLSTNAYTLNLDLTTAADPGVEATQQIHIRARANLTTSLNRPLTGSIRNATVELFEFLSTANITGPAFADYTYVLTTANIAALTGNYDALQARFTAAQSSAESIDISLFEWLIPSFGAPVYTLSMNNSTHAQAADGVVLAPWYSLSVGNTTHAQTADNAVLNPRYALLVDNTTHAQAADGITLTANLPAVLTVDNSTHAHSADNAVLAPRYSLLVDASTHAQTADNAVLAMRYSLQVDGATHAQSADNLDLTYNPPGAVELVVDASTLAHTADNATLNPAYSLSVADSTLAQTADNTVLNPAYALLVDATTHAQSVDNLDLTYNSPLAYQLDVQGTTHAQTADGVVLAPAYGLKPADATHLQSAENATLAPHVSLIVADATHAQSADNLTLTYQILVAAAVTPSHGGKRVRRALRESDRLEAMIRGEEDLALLLFAALECEYA